MDNNIEKIIDEKILFSAKQDKSYSSNNFCIMSIIINIIAAIVMFCLTRNIGGSLLFFLAKNPLALDMGSVKKRALALWINATDEELDNF